MSHALPLGGSPRPSKPSSLTIPLSPRQPSYATLCQIEEGLGQFARHPVCLIWGMRDWCLTPHFLDRFLEFFPQAEAQRLEDAGHYVMEDAREQVGARINAFLKVHPLT